MHFLALLYFRLLRIALPCLLFLGGCNQITTPDTEIVAPRPVRAILVQQSPEYQEAVRRYQQKDYQGALQQVDALLAAPGRTEAERSFLQRQRILCQSALTGKPVVPSRPAPIAPPRPTRSNADCGPQALLLACRQIDIAANLPALRKAAGTTKQGTTLAGLAKAAKSVGLKAQGVQMDRNALSALSQPAVAWVDGNHYVAVLQVKGDQATVHDPNQPEKETMPLSRLLERCGGVLLTLAR